MKKGKRRTESTSPCLYFDIVRGLVVMLADEQGLTVAVRTFPKASTPLRLPNKPFAIVPNLQGGRKKEKYVRKEAPAGRCVRLKVHVIYLLRVHSENPRYTLQNA